MTYGTSMLVALLASTAFLLACDRSPVVAETTNALTLERKIPLGDVAGRIDHLAVDPRKRRLFVAELGNNTVGVVDLDDGKVVHRLAGLKEPQGVGYVAAGDTLFVANAGDGSVHRFRASDFAPLGVTKLGDDADNIRLDERQGQVVVGYGGGALALLDAASAKPLGEIVLPGHPESFQLEKNGPRIFVNVPDAKEVTVVDRLSRRRMAGWKLDGLGGNFPMALDEAGGQLAVVYRKPATLVVFATKDGAPATRLPTCGDADDVFFDAKRRRLYVSCGEGAIDVLQKEADGYRELGRIPTVAGARTSLWVADLDRLFLAVRASGREPAAIWVYAPGS